MNLSTLVVLLAVVPQAGAAENTGFANCGFEQGTEGWRVWYADEPNAPITRYAWSADPTVAHSGKQSLRIVAPDTNGCAFVHRSSSEVAPGGLYAVSYWFRATPGLDTSAFHVRFNCRPARPPSPRKRMIAVEPVIMARKSDGPWQQRSGYVRMPDAGPMTVQLGLYLRDARGTIWIDDVEIRHVKPGGDPLADLWQYNPYRVELGSKPVRLFAALKKAGDPILGRAMRYNELLVRSAMVKEDVRRLRRLAHYASAVRNVGHVSNAPAAERHAGNVSHDVQPDAAHAAAAMDVAEKHLAALYRAYGQAYLDRQSKQRATRFDELAAALGAELDGLRCEVAAKIAAAVKRRREAGDRWDPPPAPLDVGLPAVAPDGRANQIIYAKRSLVQFQEMEKPLGLDPVQSVSMYSPGTRLPGKYDWSAIVRQWDAVRQAGIAKRGCIGTSMVLHDGCYAAPWLLQLAQKDPEILQVVRPAAELHDRGSSRQVNWWHPAVQDYARQIVGDLGRTFRDRNEFLFYVFQAECYGLYVSTNQGLREVGYGRWAERDFHRWLKDKYESLDLLNERWGSRYPTFDAIQPPVDKYVEPRTHAGPLEADWEAWRQRSFHDWRRLVYRAFKAADPHKPVLASHSQIYLRFPSPDEFDTCDLLGFHYRGSDFMPVTLYLHSISRYNGFRPLAQYENFWGVQEDHDRMGEELACRHSATKHLFRLTAWSRFLQVWWYAYTSADYLTIYDGNWLDPSYALTTLRYRSAGLPVYFRKFKRLQRALLGSRIVPSRLCVLAPTSSMRNNFPYDVTQTETRDLFWRLFPRNDVYELVPEEYLTDGRTNLDDFDVLVLPAAAYLARPLQERILRWLRAGPRLLVALGPCGVYDELGRDSRVLLDAAFGPGKPKLRAPVPERPRWTLDAPAGGDVLRARVGSSEAVLAMPSVAELAPGPEGMGGLIEQIEKTAGRAAWDDKNLLEMVVRQQNGTRYLCVLNPNVDDAAESTIDVRGKFRSVTDLDYPEGYPIPAKTTGAATTFPLRLEPGEATVIRLSP